MEGLFFLKYRTISFGWKANAYIYHNIGMAATSRIRLFGVPCSQYIDDRHVGQAPLKHFTPFASPASHGVNLFAQHISPVENAYVFPPFVMVEPVLRFLREVTFTIVVPKLNPILYWWPILQARATHCVTLGRKGDMGVLFFPGAQGSFHTRPLQWDSMAFRIVLNPDFVRS